MKRERFLARSLGANLEGTRAGLIKLVESLDKYNEGVIVVPKLEDAKKSILVDVLGEDLSSQLIKDREASFSDGSKIHLCSQETLKDYQYSSAYLFLWGTKKNIDQIESLPLWGLAIVVTWSPEDSERWESDHDVAVIYEQQSA